MISIERLLLTAALLLAGPALSADPSAEPGPAARGGGNADASPPRVTRMDLTGPIGPATADFFSRTLEGAVRDRAGALLVRMDTPGGLDGAMRDIIRDILGSPLPVIVWVAPGGARAASAGTYILYASHVAAMAPGTNLGAATPVQLGGVPGRGRPGGSGEPPREDPDGEVSDEAPKHPSGDAMTQKMVNDAAAYLRALAELRGRNAGWAERAVREAASLPAAQAVREGVVDLLAADETALLLAVDGRQVTTATGPSVLRTADARVVAVTPGWRTRVLAVLTNPSVAYVLMLVGVYGLVFEFMNPGAVVPGVVGAICLLLALYSLQMLPVNYAGVALILLGAALLLGEAFAPSFGVLGVGGATALAIGSIMLFRDGPPGFTLPPALIAGVTGSSVLVLTVLVGALARSRKRPVVTGVEALVGAQAQVIDAGHVLLGGERWNARGAQPLIPGATVRVRAVEGLTLTVEQAPPESSHRSPEESP
jgi:membrane-bound serine protease (ClpP class)